MTDRLAPGDTAPDFTLSTDTGESVTLSDLRGGKVIVYFYPAAMTPGCTKQACDFSESLESLKSDGYTVLGISPDKPEKAREVPRQGAPLAHPALRRRQGRHDRVGRLRGEEGSMARSCRA